MLEYKIDLDSLRSGLMGVSDAALTILLQGQTLSKLPTNLAELNLLLSNLTSTPHPARQAANPVMGLQTVENSVVNYDYVLVGDDDYI